MTLGCGERAESPPPAAVTSPPAEEPVELSEPPRQTVSLSAPRDSRNSSIKRIEQIVSEILRRHPRLRLAETGGTALSIAVPADQPKMVVPSVDTTVGTPVSVQPVAAASAHILNFFADQLQFPRNEFTSTNAIAFERLADAIVSKSTGKLRAAIAADPELLPALRLGAELFRSEGEEERAIAAAEKILALSPKEHALRKDLIQWLLASGKAPDAVPHLAAVLAANRNDADALFTIARLSLSAVDGDRFRAASARYNTLAKMNVFHEPDLLVAQGQIDSAVKQYYELERSDPNNGALALKIGRIAVLRHSLPIADIELAKLQRLDPEYGYPLLRAYVGAEKRGAAEAERYLNLAQLGADWKDEPFTASGEVFAILNQPSKAIDAFKTAAARGEGTLSYILSNPLFRYLEFENEYRALKASLESQRKQLRDRLSELRL